MANTPRFSAPYPVGTTPTDVDGWIKQLADSIDANSTMGGQGPLSGRPVSSPGSPGKTNRIYVATDQSPMSVWYDYGTGWIQVGSFAAGSIGTLQLADLSVTTAKLAELAVATSKIADLAVTSGKLADGSVTEAKIAAALKPSQGAAGSAEALRSLGTGAGQAVSGNDARLSDQRVPADGSVTNSKLAAGSVTNDKLADQSVNVNKIVPGSVYGDRIPNDAIMASHIAAGQVGASEIADGSVSASKLAPISWNFQAANYTLVLSDRNRMIDVNVGSDVSIFIPVESAVPFSTGDTVHIHQAGPGQVHVYPNSGVQLLYNPGFKTAGQYAVATLIKRGSNQWVLFGNIST